MTLIEFMTQWTALETKISDAQADLAWAQELVESGKQDDVIVSVRYASVANKTLSLSTSIMRDSIQAYLNDLVAQRDHLLSVYGQLEALLEQLLP